MERQNAVGLNILMINSESLILLWCHIKERNPSPFWCWSTKSKLRFRYFILLYLCLPLSLPVYCMSLNLFLSEGSFLDLSVSVSLCMSLPKGFALSSLNSTESITQRRNGIICSISNRTLKGIKSLTTAGLQWTQTANSITNITNKHPEMSVCYIQHVHLIRCFQPLFYVFNQWLS